MKSFFKNVKDKTGELLFDVVTDIPASVMPQSINPESHCKLLTKRAALKAAATSAALSVPGGFAGILTALPDIATIWKIQAQLVSDIAANYGKYAELNRETMVWCLFRHSATQLLRDTFLRTGTRVITQKTSVTVLQNILKQIGIQQSSKLLGKTFTRAVPLIGASVSGAYAFYDTYEVGKTAQTYFKALSDQKLLPTTET